MTLYKSAAVAALIAAMAAGSAGTVGCRSEDGYSGSGAGDGPERKPEPAQTSERVPPEDLVLSITENKYMSDQQIACELKAGIKRPVSPDFKQGFWDEYMEGKGGGITTQSEWAVKYTREGTEYYFEPVIKDGRIQRETFSGGPDLFDPNLTVKEIIESRGDKLRFWDLSDNQGLIDAMKNLGMDRKR